MVSLDVKASSALPGPGEPHLGHGDGLAHDHCHPPGPGDGQETDAVGEVRHGEPDALEEPLLHLEAS